MSLSFTSSPSINLLFGAGFDSPLWAAILSGTDTAPDGVEAAAVLPGSQVLVALPATREISLRYGTAEWSLRRHEALVARSHDPASLRLRGTDGELFLLGFRQPLIASMLEPFRPGLLDPVRRAVFGAERSLSVVLPLRTGRISELVESMRRPAVGGTGLPFWYEGHVKALLACLLFEEAPAEQREFFCSKQRRLADERIETVKSLLRARIDEPLGLDELAAAAGCSPSYLSRTFSASTGLTISQFHRKLRIERAAHLISVGECNVSEAAVEVGYQSLSHFSKAFRQVMGCVPSAYAA